MRSEEEVRTEIAEMIEEMPAFENMPHHDYLHGWTDALIWWLNDKPEEKVPEAGQ